MLQCDIYLTKFGSIKRTRSILRLIPKVRKENNIWYEGSAHLGLVPTIVKDKSIIYESNVMLEYLDEKFGGSPRIMPASPEGKAHARIWGDHIAKRIVAGNFKLQLAQEKHEQDEAREKLLDGVHELFEQLDTSKGTYFGGSNPGYLDYLLVPFTVRWHYGMERFRDLVVPDSDASWQAFRSWRQAMESRDSVKNTMSEEKHLMVIINRYLKNEAQSEAAKATRKNEAVP